MKQYKYGYYRLKKENKKLKEQVQELQTQVDSFYRKED